MERRPVEPPSTQTDAGTRLAEWMTTDAVLGLRAFGTNIEFRLPLDQPVITVGSHPDCNIFIGDNPTVSRHHATLERVGSHVVVKDNGAKNRTYCNGEPSIVFQLLPGAVVAFGTAEYVAFSERTQALRAGLQRYLGYGITALRDVELAQQAVIRRGTPSQPKTMGKHLVVVSPRGGGAVALAKFLHQHVNGDAWPFVQRPTVPEDIPGQKALLARCRYGTLVLNASDLPKERTYLLNELAADTYHVRLVLVVGPRDNIERIVGEPLRSQLVVLKVPPLSDRRADLGQIANESLAYHLHRAGASAMLLTADDYTRLDAQRWKGNHDELDECVSRLVLVRRLGSATAAAKELGMSTAAISQWAKKYGFRLR